MSVLYLFDLYTLDTVNTELKQVHVSYADDLCTEYKFEYSENDNTMAEVVIINDVLTLEEYYISCWFRDSF